MTTRQRRVEQAEGCAAEYYHLCADGRYPEADQVRRTIDDLVGAWNVTDPRTRRWTWSRTVRQIADTGRA